LRRRPESEFYPFARFEDSNDPTRSRSLILSVWLVLRSQ
jgi:hypothetical protein